jgi:mRNA-degrading endonuclease toxin of MazEF toxin-antitoxin module
VGDGVPADRREALVGARVVGIGRTPPAIGPRRGDIHLIDFPDLGGNVIRGPHPGVVVRTDRMAKSTTVIVAPMTSTARSAPEKPRDLVPVAGREAGLPKDGYVKCDQLATLPAILLGPKLGRHNPKAIDRLDDGLRFVLGL